MAPASVSFQALIAPTLAAVKFKAEDQSLPARLRDEPDVKDAPVAGAVLMEDRKQQCPLCTLMKEKGAWDIRDSLHALSACWLAKRLAWLNTPPTGGGATPFEDKGLQVLYRQHGRAPKPPREKDG